MKIIRFSLLAAIFLCPLCLPVYAQGPLGTSVLGLPITWDECKARVANALTAEGFERWQDFGNGWQAYKSSASTSVGCIHGNNETVVMMVVSGDDNVALRERLLNRIRTPRSSSSIPSIGGSYTFQGSSGTPQPTIEQNGGSLSLNNGQGWQAKGRVENGKIIVDEWGVTGELAENACRINWSNGTWWRRVTCGGGQPNVTTPPASGTAARPGKAWRYRATRIISDWPNATIARQAVDVRGGEVELMVMGYGELCPGGTESLLFKWSFPGDISALHAGEDIVANLHTRRISADNKCRGQLSDRVHLQLVSSGTVSVNLGNWPGGSPISTPFDERFMALRDDRASASGGNPSGNNASGALRVNLKESVSTPVTYFALVLSGSCPTGYTCGRILVLYEYESSEAAETSTAVAETLRPNSWRYAGTRLISDWPNATITRQAVDVRGGEVELIVNGYGELCPGGSERVLFKWSFPGDISLVRPGEDIAVNLHARRISADRCRGELANRIRLQIVSSGTVASHLGNWPGGSPVGNAYDERFMALRDDRASANVADASGNNASGALRVNLKESVSVPAANFALVLSGSCPTGYVCGRILSLYSYEPALK